MPTVAKAETFTIKMQQDIDRQAAAASGGLARLEAQIAREQAALGRLTTVAARAMAQLEVLKKGDENGVVDIAAYRKQEAAVAAMGARAAAQKDKIAAMGEKLTAGKKEAQSAGESFKALGDHMGVTGGQTQKLVQMLAQMPPYVAAIAAGILIWSAAISGVAAVLWKGISASGEMRDELLKLKAATVYSAYGFGGPLYNGLVASRVQAEQMQATINRLNGSFGGSRAELADYAVQARKAGFQGKQFDTVLRAMAIAHTGGSKEMAGQFLAMARDARFFGRSIDDLAQRVDKKFGKLAAEKMLKLDVQLEKLGKDIEWIFGGAYIDPFLKGLQSILSLFSAESESATALRNVIARMVESAIGLFLDLAITLVQTYIWLKTHKTAWESVKLVVMGVGVAIGLLAATVALAAVVIAVGVALMLSPFIALGIAIAAGIRKFQELRKEGLGFGRSIVEGIAAGILAVPNLIANTLKGVVSGAIDSAKDALGIHSPSRVAFMQIGAPFTMGVASGIQARASMVEAASFGVVEAAMAPANTNAMAPMGEVGPRVQATSGDGRSVTIEFNNCHFGSGQDDVKRQMIEALEETGFAAVRAS